MGNAAPDPTITAISKVLAEEGASSPNMDADTLAGRIANELPDHGAAVEDERAALDRANERIAELEAEREQIERERDEAREALRGGEK